MDPANHKSYSADNVIVAAVATSLTLVLVVLLYFSLFLSESYHPPYVVPGNSGLLIACVWVLAVTTIASAVSAILHRLVRRFPTSWLMIPVGATFLFVYSLWLYGYSVAVSAYSAGNPFATEPPSLGRVLGAALLISAFLSVFTAAAGFACYTARIQREDEDKVRIIRS